MKQNKKEKWFKVIFNTNNADEAVKRITDVKGGSYKIDTLQVWVEPTTSSCNNSDCTMQTPENPCRCKCVDCQPTEKKVNKWKTKCLKKQQAGIIKTLNQPTENPMDWEKMHTGEQVYNLKERIEKLEKMGVSSNQHSGSANATELREYKQKLIKKIEEYRDNLDIEHRRLGWDIVCEDVKDIIEK